ncbi:MAG TPA: hypothetical protein VHB93_01880 [Candidatus Paceibacterota bacterium]|nr:hypothetical protein [Candidatus Paceibacterota bacterium]
MLIEVGVDLNGPLRNARHTSLLVLRRITGLHIPKHQFFGKYTIELGTKFRGRDGKWRALTYQDWSEANAYIHEDPQRFIQLWRSTGGACEALHRVKAEHHKIKVVSGMRSFGEDFIRDLLRKKELVVDEVQLTQRKPKLCLYRPCDVVIDNEPQHFKGLNPQSHKLLFMSGDKFMPVPEGVVRTTSWDQNLQYVFT